MAAVTSKLHKATLHADSGRRGKSGCSCKNACGLLGVAILAAGSSFPLLARGRGHAFEVHSGRSQRECPAPGTRRNTATYAGVLHSNHPDRWLSHAYTGEAVLPTALPRAAAGERSRWPSVVSGELARGPTGGQESRVQWSRTLLPLAVG